MIQTYSPDHYSLTAVRTHDTMGFCHEEMEHRKNALLPPLCSQALVWVTGPDPGRSQALARDVADRLQRAKGDDIQILGPAEAPIKKINDRYRWVIQLRAPTITPVHRLLWRVLEDPRLRVGAKERLVVDIDPYNVL